MDAGQKNGRWTMDTFLPTYARNAPHMKNNYFDKEYGICRVNVGSTCQPGNHLTCEADCVPIGNQELSKLSWCQCNSNYPISTRSTHEPGIDLGYYLTAPCVKDKETHYSMVKNVRISTPLLTTYNIMSATVVTRMPT
ncbi:hypothetical protein Fcan01_23923 [Folsomia candida]|uniref:Uncharacterized protein n=1 Tax=Folsomia candida TaxID=158441 RepID=A0A226D7G2_FOLCA|nr:hypothetical protein Fcan01_23923 [Folsomia candida]